MVLFQCKILTPIRILNFRISGFRILFLDRSIFLNNNHFHAFSFIFLFFSKFPVLKASNWTVGFCIRLNLVCQLQWADAPLTLLKQWLSPGPNDRFTKFPETGNIKLHSQASMVPWPSGQITPAFEAMKAIQQLPKLPRGLTAQPESGELSPCRVKLDPWVLGTGRCQTDHLPSFTTSIDHLEVHNLLTALLEVLCDK